MRKWRSAGRVSQTGLLIGESFRIFALSRWGSPADDPIGIISRVIARHPQLGQQSNDEVFWRGIEIDPCGFRTEFGCDICLAHSKFESSVTRTRVCSEPIGCELECRRHQLLGPKTIIEGAKDAGSIHHIDGVDRYERRQRSQNPQDGHDDETVGRSSPCGECG